MDKADEQPTPLDRVARLDQHLAALDDQLRAMLKRVKYRPREFYKIIDLFGELYHELRQLEEQIKDKPDNIAS